MENLILKAISSQNVEDLYRQIVTMSVEELHIPVKKRKKYIGFGKVCGFHLFWIGVSENGEVYFCTRKRMSRESDDNRIRIPFDEKNKDEIIASIREIYGKYVDAETQGLLPQLELENYEYLRKKRHSARNLELESKPDERIISLWKELSAEVSASLQTCICDVPFLGAADTERIRQSCSDIESVYDRALDIVADIRKKNEPFIKNLNLYRRYIEDDKVTLSDLAQDQEFSRERARQRMLKASGKINTEIKRAVYSNNADMNACVEELYSIVKSVDFNIVLIYLFGTPCLSKRKRNAIIDAFWGNNISAKLAKTSKEYNERLELYNKESSRQEKLLAEYEQFKSKIVFPSTATAVTESFARSENDLVFGFEQAFYKKIKKFESIIDICVNPQIIYYSSSTTDHRPQLLIRMPDNTLALIVIVPTINMAFYHNTNRFNMLHRFCKENGYGYLITDDRGNSIYDIKYKSLDPELVRSLNEIFEKRTMILWKDIQDIKQSRPVSNMEIVTYVLQNNLYFEMTPFRIRHRY